MRNTGLEEAQAGIKIARRNINYFSRWHHLYGRKKRGTKEALDEGEREEWNSSLKLNIQKNKIMASDPITSWQIDRETVETVSNFIFLGSKSTGDGDCSHEIKRCLLFGRKIMTSLDSILKNREITLLKEISLECSLWESNFLGRLIRSPGVPKERGVWKFSRRKKRTNFLFSPSIFFRIMYPAWGQSLD